VQVHRPAKQAAKFLEERAAAALLAGEMDPATSQILHERDDSYAVTPFGVHTLTFDSTLDEIRDAIGESHFAVEVRDLSRHCVVKRMLSRPAGTACVAVMLKTGA
jgi:hypothetical protein